MSVRRSARQENVKRKPIRHLIVVSDLHCGSSVAILPPDFTNIEGNAVKQNAIQRWYWQAWLEMCDEWLPAVTRGEPFALVLNGDLIDGLHHHTKEVVSLEIGDHIGIAIQILKPLSARAAATFVVEGTDCHSQNAEHGIARELEAIGPDGLAVADKGKSGAWRRLDLTIAGLRCIFQHHITTSGRTWTEATGLGTALMNERLEAAAAGEVPPSVLISAHRHRPGVYQTSSGLSAVTGAWQALTRYARKVVPSARCWPSAIHLEFDGGALPRLRQFDRKPPPGPQITL